jgi:hypothetical protein
MKPQLRTEVVILRLVKEPYEYERDALLEKFSRHFLTQVFPASLLDVSAGDFKRALAYWSVGRTRNDYKLDGRSTVDSNSRGARVALCAHPTRIDSRL